jgi:hypothetical protein
MARASNGAIERADPRASGRASRAGALLATGLCVLVGLPSPWVAICGFALAAIPSAALLGWWLAPRAVRTTGGDLVVVAVVLGGLAAVAGALAYVIAAMVVSAMPGSSVAQPETPLGYVLFPLLVMAALGPVLAIPGSLLAGVWVMLLRRIADPAASQPRSTDGGRDGG